ncbi:uncharacterized protein LOC126906674 isoform X2 [Daktulosphaira vitifoliae]|uniref:uncharacterized protein LOC126906674 isoform X2 n=1 Tax=Daktulosphaira vitifoliae TaxID=58002 RepID=UPI0021AA5D4D|nr:uncharacterized protein LOC126906674 isoform X2 [Daktulosphaira vitifoliae]
MEKFDEKFPLLNGSLNYLNKKAVGHITNIVRNKNKFIFHLIFEDQSSFKKILDLDLTEEDLVTLTSNLEFDSLYGCLHPNTKKWVRCYIVSKFQGQAIVALCDTGEITKTKKLKNIPNKYKTIPVTTFQAEVMCICPQGILRHLMENFHSYTATFESFNNETDSEEYKKMFLVYEGTIMVEFILKNWDPRLCVESCDSSEVFKNGCTVIMAKPENYDPRHIFVRSSDKFIKVCREVEAYCYKNKDFIEKKSIKLGEIVGVKYSNKFTRGKIINISGQNFSLYLIDSGVTITTTLSAIVNLSPQLKEIPPTVCLVGLKDITNKPWLPEAQTYIYSLFENSTTMILEYNDNDAFGLDSVSLTIVNNNQDVNSHLKDLLKLVKEPSVSCFTPYQWVNSNSTHEDTVNNTNKENIGTDTLVKTDHVYKSSEDFNKFKKYSISSGNVVYMTAFIDLTEIYVRKVDDDTELDILLEKVDKYCAVAPLINKTLSIGQMVGVKSVIDGRFYRGEVLNQIDSNNYLIRYIDYGDKDTVPISNIVEIPIEYMILSTVKAITLKGINLSSSLSDLAKEYISNLLENYEPMIINFSNEIPLRDVTLLKVVNNENVNETLNKLISNQDLKTRNISLNTLSEVIVHEDSKNGDECLTLCKGDAVYITEFKDTLNVYVRKIEDETSEFLNFIEEVNSYCASAKTVDSLKLNEIVGAKSLLDGNFYRGRVIEILSDNNYKLQFIDYGNEECLNITDIVFLSNNLKQVTPSIHHLILKDVQLTTLTNAAKDYITHLCENESLIIEYIYQNFVVLKTSNHIIVNEHLNKLICDSNEIENNCTKKNNTEIETILDTLNKPLNDLGEKYLYPGDKVYMSAFENLTEIYVRKLKDNNEEFHKLLDEVDLFCSSAEAIKRLPKIGDLIGAKSSLDENFYRGVILDKVDNDSYLIQFIDFGDKDTVHILDIVDLPKDLMCPSNISTVTLKGLDSKPLTKAAKEYVIKLMQSYIPMIIDFDPLESLKKVVLITENGNENVNEKLTKLLADENNTDKNHVAKKDTNTNEFVDTLSLLKSGDIVYMTAFIDLNNIFVRKVEDHNDEFVKLIERVHTYCSLGNTSDSKPPNLLEIFGAKSVADGCFYRARITSKIDEKNYNIVFIDYGYEECVNLSDIVPLPIELQQVKPSICLIGLKDIPNDHLNDGVYKYLETLLLLCEPLKLECEDLKEVTLTVINGEVNILNHIKKLLTDNINPEDIKSASSNLENGTIIPIPKIPLLTNNSVITVYSFVNARDIYIKVDYNKEEMDVFLNNFSSYCSSIGAISETPIIGEVCGIRSSINDLFYRGIIKEQISNNQYKVKFFDLENEDVVELNSIVKIPDYLKKIPQSVYVVSLKGVDVELFNGQVISYINWLCEKNIPLIIELEESRPNYEYSVTLKTVDTNQNINVHLTKLMSEKERESPEAMQLLSKGDIVYISSFDDLQNLSVRRINNGTDKFKSFLEKFSSSCALENPINRTPIIGEIIAAKKNCNKYCRAEIIEAVDHENYNVCFIDYGTRGIVNIKNIVQLSNNQLKNCATSLYLVNLKGLPSGPLNSAVQFFINTISKNERFIIDSITDQNKVVLISVNTKENLNDKIKVLMGSRKTINNGIKEVYIPESAANFDKSIIKYYKIPLDIPSQVWIAQKISASVFFVYTAESRLELRHLESIMFEDSTKFQPVKLIKQFMPCAIYFAHNWYRGEIYEVINETTARVKLIDLGNFEVIRCIKEIFSLLPKYQGKSMLIKINIQPIPEEILYANCYKVIGKKFLEDSTIVKLIEPNVMNHSYGDLENVGLPSFSSTPIPDDMNGFDFNKDNLDQNVNNGNVSKIQPEIITNKLLSNNQNSLNQSSQKFVIKDVQHARWPKGSKKNLTFLCQSKDYLVMRDHLVDDAVTDLETKIQEYCLENIDMYSPALEELCIAKYSDDLWYRALCVKKPDMFNKNNNYTVYFLDWGIEYSVIPEDLREMPKNFIYLPASAIKCFVKDLDVSVTRWSVNTIKAVGKLMLSVLNCHIIEKISNDCYLIDCETIVNLVNEAEK